MLCALYKKSMVSPNYIFYEYFIYLLNKYFSLLFFIYQLSLTRVYRMRIPGRPHLTHCCKRLVTLEYPEILIGRGPKWKNLVTLVW